MNFATTPIKLQPFNRPSATHAAFDVLAFTDAHGAEQRLGLKPGDRFYFTRAGQSAALDAAAAAQQLAAQSGTAYAVVGAHPGMLFVVPVYLRGAAGANVPVTAALDALEGATLTGRHGKVFALAGADRVVDLQQVAPTLGNGRS